MADRRLIALHINKEKTVAQRKRRLMPIRKRTAQTKSSCVSAS